MNKGHSGMFVANVKRQKYLSNTGHTGWNVCRPVEASGDLMYEKRQVRHKIMTNLSVFSPQSLPRSDCDTGVS